MCSSKEPVAIVRWARITGTCFFPPRSPNTDFGREQLTWVRRFEVRREGLVGGKGVNAAMVVPSR